ncbi:MAG TPA: nucleotidyl transferase AbiEii/AbiGii toxin family protein [Mariniphaga anaerophila]|uniref:Nucleotidyl transferase AbiEii/AbiGii toxin family protein n=1 Tax=Mariniphaga anaerophila TaxID=1484053 RepID=A0A831PQ06_9BACT|nr:nucleotidyl transferase AbiEii/AbiGii toxin family protein [Mariniphaga anaerophila]
MVDINKHKFFLVQLLKAIYSDIELAGNLGFKGGTALMFFYDLPRFSVDLDFNLLHVEKENLVYEKIRNIVFKHGKIFDEAKKFYGPVIVLDYGIGERKLKIEISNRIFNDRYEIKNLLGINMKVMVKQDMFAHKLCTLFDREVMANRDIFDCWFFMKNQTPVNKGIVEFRMKMPFDEYIQKCIDRLEKIEDKKILHGMGDLMEEDLKKFVRTKLRTETIELLKFYKKFPILE